MRRAASDCEILLILHNPVNPVQFPAAVVKVVAGTMTEAGARPQQARDPGDTAPAVSPMSRPLGGSGLTQGIDRRPDHGGRAAERLRQA